MSLAGNLRTMDLPEILQWISGGRKTGALHLERRSIKKRIYFHDGVISSSWSNDPRESLGQFLIRDMLVTEEQLFKALLRQEKEGRLLGAILVADGSVGEAEIRRTLGAKAEETIYDLFLWADGRFEFKDGDVPPQGQINISIEVTQAIFEGIRRVDEWKRIRAVFPSSDTVVKAAGEATADLAPGERRLLEAAGSGRTLGQISLELRKSEFAAAEAALHLFGRGLLGVDRVETEAKLEDPVAVIQDLLATAYRRLTERRYDQALEAYEGVLALDRLNQNAKKGLVTVLEARSRERSLKKVPLDKVPRLAMDLAELTRFDLDPQEGFVISRINGEWDVQSILKLCPMSEEDALLIFSRLIERKVIELH